MGSLLFLYYHVPQNPIPTIKAPTIDPQDGLEVQVYQSILMPVCFSMLNLPQSMLDMSGNRILSSST